MLKFFFGQHYQQTEMPKNRFTYSNFKDVFGELQSVHRVRRGIFEIIVIPSLIFFLFLGGIIAYRETQDIWVIPICVLPFFLMFCGIIWHLVSTRKDELKIYQNGFTYKGGKNIQSCLWKEIKTYHHRELNSREIAEFENETFPLSSIEKKNGEIIEFDHDLPGTPEIIKRVSI